MSIYSANRTSSNGTAVIAANEAYKTSNFGNILVECAMNDMALFEGVLSCDFHEIVGLKEGTLLEAEVKETNKKSFKELKNKCIETIKKWWAKVKALFRAAIDKIAVWANTPKVKMFVKHFEKKLKDSNWKGSVPAIVYDYNNKDFLDFKYDADVMSERNYNDGKNSHEIARSVLARHINAGGDFQIRDYTKLAIDACKKDATLNAGNAADFVKKMDCKDAIKTLNDNQRDADKSVKEYINLIKKTDEEKGNAALLTTITSAYQTVNTIIAKAAISVVRADVFSRKKALTRALAGMKGADKVNTEAAVMDDEYEFDTIMNNTDELDTETQEAVAEFVKSIV